MTMTNTAGTHRFKIEAGVYYDTMGAAKFLGKSLGTISYYVYRSQDLKPTVQFGKLLIFSEKDLAAFKKIVHRVGRPPLDAKAPRRNRKPRTHRLKPPVPAQTIWIADPAEIIPIA